MSIPDITTTSPHHWKYLSEGGANIVFSYDGPRDADERFYGKVLRLRKNSTAVEDEENAVLFQAEIISRLVSQKHLVDVEIVLSSPSWLEKLSSLCTNSRPTWRTDNIDLECTKGFLASNLVSSPISAEIKPKWSFLRLGMCTCRFCMHSSCRGWTTTYCPLDIFSASPTRIKNALYALYDWWSDDAATQNNFRLFAGGSLVSPDDLLPTSQRLGLLLSSEKEVRELVVETLHASLVQPESLLLLKTLNALQRTLDGEGIEGLASLWNRVHQKTTVGNGYFQPTLDEWKSFITEHFERQGSSVSPPAQSDEDQLRYHILSYLLSSTFKDCSIMIMLPGLLHHSLPISSFPSRITLIDLDQKPVQRLQKWLEQDRNIQQRYTELVSQKEAMKKECVDEWCLER
ncbi:inositol-pentakisphosphate 2-kinase [Lentinula aciculospora]|uniref:Inositol-pentakisphosphate 2-kinase n=1 Tax=Lentinula aciculospora TaxID=153920 RepID=A0A9W9AS53_9AGAR|nr:inositol-pentakisphosphate 2-kinase [Lentinula aciculospora]